MEGLEFLVNAHNNGVATILGDEMGLGKTLQTIAFLAHLKFIKGLTGPSMPSLSSTLTLTLTQSSGLMGPSLVIAPLSVLSSWLIEFKKFCPSLRVVKLHSSDPGERDRLKDANPNRNVML